MSDDRSDLERRLLREGNRLYTEGYTYESVTMEEAADVTGVMRRALVAAWMRVAEMTPPDESGIADGHDKTWHLIRAALERLGEAGGAR